MLTIPDELKTFKDTVTEGALGNMNTTISNLSDKLSTLSNACTTAENGFSASYKSENKSKILNKFSKISEILSKVSTSITGDLQPILSKSSELLTDIDELITLSEKVKEQEGIKSTEMAKEPENRNNTLISEANRIISTSTSEFYTLKSTAESLLSSLKSMDANLDFVTQFSSNDYLTYLDQLQYGSFERHSFTASNGLTVEYWLYIPDYGVEVENLPCMLYMHGGSTHQNVSLDHAVDYGLGSHIKNKTITPSGMVIVPAVCDFTDRGIQALKELTDSVVEEYHCDENKISVSGHSYGGITSYRLVNKYPDYFSCVVGISGCDNVTESFKGVKVWEFGGTSENGDGLTSYTACSNAIKKVNSVGGYGFFTGLQTGHAGTNKMAYEREYTSPDGDVVNPIEWAFRQSKDESISA